MGHSSIMMTMDGYGHLFPRGDDTAELAAAEMLNSPRRDINATYGVETPVDITARAAES
jgi:hypothetical protein